MTHFFKNYPEIILNLPEIEINKEGIKGWLLQDENHQLVFFEIQKTAKIPEHSHGAQWGIVIDGEMNLNINGSKKLFKKGDSYCIPAGVLHSAVFLKKTFVIDFFDDRNRYKMKI